MSKLKLNLLIVREWLIEKYNGNNWDKFIFGAILIGALIVTSKIIGFILK